MTVSTRCYAHVQSAPKTTQNADTPLQKMSNAHSLNQKVAVKICQNWRKVAILFEYLVFKKCASRVYLLVYIRSVHCLNLVSRLSILLHYLHSPLITPHSPHFTLQVTPH